jgi:hypothetical protein
VDTIRKDQLLAIRPDISTLDALSPDESFQNHTLRPILKFQHELIVLLFEQHLIKRKVDIRKMEPNDRFNYVEKAFQKDIALRNQLQGIIVGLFTEEEFIQFTQAEKELSKRLLNLLVQRIQSTLS